MSPLYRPEQAFREEPSGRLLALTWVLIAIAMLGVVLWKAGDLSVGRWIALPAGFAGGSLYCIVQVRAALRRMETRDRQE